MDCSNSIGVILKIHEGRYNSEGHWRCVMGSVLLYAFFLFQNPPQPGTEAPTVQQPALTPDATTHNPTTEPAPEAAPAAAETPPTQNPGDVLLPSETKHVQSTARKMFGNFCTDQKAIWTSPFHIHHDDAKWWVIFGTGTAG